MRATRVDTSVEKQLLVGMIMSDDFLKRITPVLDINYLDLTPARTVAGWVLEYWEAYRKAPKAMMREVFDNRRAALSEEHAEWISEFLAKLSNHYEKEGFNENYVFDNSVNYFRRQRLLRSTAEIKQLLERGQVAEAEHLWLQGAKLPVATDVGIDPFDPATVRELFRRDEHRVTMWTGIPTLDQMVGPMKSGWLVLFMAPMKRGKTFAWGYMAVQAALQGLNAVFVSLETEQEDNAARFWMNVGSMVNTSAGREVEFPYYPNIEDPSRVSYHAAVRPTACNKRAVLAAVKDFNQLARGRVQLKTYPMGTASIEDVRHYLDTLEVYEGFVADVIVVDYLGILKSQKGMVGRDHYDFNTRELKALAQERQAIVISGHQGTKKTLDAVNIHSTDVPEDVRILAHLDVLFSLNQTEDERDESIMRVGVLLHRHRRFSTKKQAKLLQQFEAGQFALEDALIDRPLPLEHQRNDLKGYKREGE